MKLCLSLGTSAPLIQATASGVEQPRLHLNEESMLPPLRPWTEEKQYIPAVYKDIEGASGPYVTSTGWQQEQRSTPMLYARLT